MRVLLALILFCGLAGSGGAATPKDAYVTEIATAVYSAALEFIAPRALDAVTVQQLALWGLRGVTTLDATLTTDMIDGSVTLRRGEAILFQRPIPNPDSPDAWGALVAGLAGAAWDNSAAIRAAGNQAVIAAFFDEMFNHLDPYSRYVAPEAADQDRARRTGEAGVGVVLTAQQGAIVVQSVNADGPAAEAGIAAGDRIVAVDEQPTRGEELDTVVGWIAGQEGSEVSVTVRGRNGITRTVTLDRVILPPETVFGSRNGDVITLRISAFASDTDERLGRELLRQIGRGGIGSLRGIVIDLRGNRGGLLRQAVSATDLLLKSGVIVTTAGRNPQAAHEWRATGQDIAAGKPIVTLVDGRSASAAEIMAAALEDQGRSVVVGSSTLGKGLVQTITTLPDGGELFVSWSRVLAPAGWPIQGLGVLPQICTSLGRDSLEQQLDSLAHGDLASSAQLARHRAARAPLPAAEVVEQRATCPATEGRDMDLVAARWLLTHPAAYQSALLGPP